MKARNGPRPVRPDPKTKLQNQAISIMGTNNSSIVSKRSVERLYFANEPHFFRYFVKKPQRRSPLINRGYWLRMKAIDQAVCQFLKQDSPKRKVVINLGCGYDPLPWQCITRYPDACVGAMFIDVDYKDLMIKKRSVVQNTIELNSILTNIDILEGDVLFRSDQYVQLGCDLRDLVAFNRVLTDVVDIYNCSIILIAEVSITYMNVEAADALIGWAQKLPEARFCLLEQLIPDGNGHPFSQTMMAHFDKLQTPLGAVREYPTEIHQRERFQSLGWPKVSICNLWKLWNSPHFITSDERIALDAVEPFDEWEELALFGCHYFLLVADSSNSCGGASTTQIPIKPGILVEQSSPAEFGIQGRSTFSEYQKAQGYKRFAASMPTQSHDRAQDNIGVFGGMGLITRVDSCDEYSVGSAEYRTLAIPGCALTPSSRMCHTITDLGDTSLLVGGRTSPDNSSRESWLFHRWLNIWERVDDLPWPLYRHQATNLGHGYVLVSPGRIDSKKISQSFVVWHRRTGWVVCANNGERPPSSYGAVFVASDKEALKDLSCSRTGIYAGGMSLDSCLLEDVWQWNLEGLYSKSPNINFHRLEGFNSRLVARYGATALNFQGGIYIVGGVLKSEISRQSEEVCLFEFEENSVSVSTINLEFAPPPLLIGSTVFASENSLVITGGSAVCFSFGTFWNKGCYTLNIDSSNKNHSGNPASLESPTDVWKLVRTITAEAPRLVKDSPNSAGPISTVTVERVRLGPNTDFDKIRQASTPVIFEKADIGPCTTTWTREYLKEKVGSDREVIVHEARTEHMDFKSKNFAYVTRRLGSFLDQIESGEKLYLRTLSSDRPSEQPADIKNDFPSIANDFRLPPELSFVTANAHSSPLRISGPVNMWLHYDVMANVYCQVRGSKKMILFPPSDVKHLSFEPGSSSSHINVFEEIEGSGLADSHPHEALLQPGDILFLPPLWPHTASPTSGVSIAVNMFFRSLTTGYAAGKDVYGNRDLQAYEKGRQDIAKIVRSFDTLPPDLRGFYLQRLADELLQKV
ncbi:leucine carboxyl methyltransferase [Diplocarpon rosae]|nr:leucine carboxyl methyltransferase [Diplocarpon rosae]